MRIIAFITDPPTVRDILIHVGEPITPNLVLGLIAVFAGIWIATSEAKPAR